MAQVITYCKTYQERLSEFVNVLGGSKLRSVADIKKEWSVYLELSMDPNGWQAIWKIPRLLCEELNIEYPTRVLVYVDNINFDELLASLCVLVTPMHIVLPNKYYTAFLTDLSITTEQDKSIGLNLESTANCLDMLTFFYTHIAMPWDDYDDDTSDWLGKHLELRLHLYYDMHNNSISKFKTERLHSLLNKARRLQALRSSLESKIEHHDDNMEVEKFLCINVSLALIRSEIEILANPLFRNVCSESPDELQPQTEHCTPINWIVFQLNDTIDDQIVLLNSVKDIIGSDATIRPVSKVGNALGAVNSGDTIFFNKGTYEISECAFLPNAVTIKGLYSRDETILSARSADVLLNCCGSLVLENITLDVKTAQCGVLSHSGSVALKNCKILGDGKTSTHRGVIALESSKIKIIDCELSNFYTAIIGYSLSSILLQNCTVSDVSQGLKIFDKCDVDVENVSFINCKDSGIWLETCELQDDAFQHGHFSLLEKFDDIKLKNVVGKCNGKGDAVVIRKSTLQPITDLFSNPELDPTIIHDESNDEVNMNVSLNTDGYTL